MKKTTFNPGKKIMASASMLLVSTMMLSSATYAWFTMNTTVTVDGMTLNVKADSTYLIIGQSSELATLQNASTGNLKDITINPAASLTVFPSAHKAAVTNTTTAGTVGNWYYKYAESPTASAAAATETERTIDSAKFNTDYVLHETVYVTLAEGSEAASNLRCTGVTFDGQNVSDAVTVLVSTASAIDEEDKGSNFTLGNTQLAATVTDSAVIPVDIWIYYNGNDDSVYTNNKASLKGASVALTFEVDYAAT